MPQSSPVMMEVELLVVIKLTIIHWKKLLTLVRTLERAKMIINNPSRIKGKRKIVVVKKRFIIKRKADKRVIILFN